MQNNVLPFPAVPANASEFDAINEAFMDDEQRARIREGVRQSYDDQRRREEAYRGDAREISLETFSARMEYQQRMQEPTQNAEGVRVGDLFYCSWGYEQTNIDYFQVVALKGAHTAILRRIASDCIGGYGMSGMKRPERNHFVGDEQYTVRTRKSRYYKDGRPEIKAPHISGQHYLHPTTDDAENGYSSYY